MNSIGKKVDIVVFIISMTLAFSTKISDFSMPQEVSRVVSIVLLFYCLATSAMRQKDKEINSMIKFVIFFYLLPAIAIHLYSLVMIGFGQMSSEFINSNFSAYAPIIAAGCGIYLFREKALKYSFLSIIIAWLIAVLVALIHNGVGIFPFAISQAYFNEYTPILGVDKNYLELHDIALSMGLFGIYYVYKKNRFTRRDIPVIVVFFVISLMGMKRIAVFGFVVAIGITVLIKKIKKKNYLKAGIINGLVMSTLSSSFVYLVFSGKFNTLLSGVNMMGRNYYYDVIKSYGELTPSFVGTGRNSVSMILTRYHSYLNVGGVHSDILKMYVENGFIMFFVWLAYYLFTLPVMIYRKLNIETLGVYVCIIAYTFIIYLTDNVENYYIYQMIFVSVPCCYFLGLLAEKRLKKEQ